MLEVFAALVTVESMMTAIAPLVPHFLMGIAAGAGILGMFMVRGVQQRRSCVCAARRRRGD